MPSKKMLSHKHTNGGTGRDSVLYAVSAGGSFVEEAGEEDLPFFSALVAYVLTLHDAQTKVEDCRRAAASKDIGGGMGMRGCDSNASVTRFRPSLRSSIISFFKICFLL